MRNLKTSREFLAPDNHSNRNELSDTGRQPFEPLRLNLAYLRSLLQLQAEEVHRFEDVDSLLSALQTKEINFEEALLSLKSFDEHIQKNPQRSEPEDASSILTTAFEKQYGKLLQGRKDPDEALLEKATVTAILLLHHDKDFGGDVLYPLIKTAASYPKNAGNILLPRIFDRMTSNLWEPLLRSIASNCWLHTSPRQSKKFFNYLAQRINVKEAVSGISKDEDFEKRLDLARVVLALSQAAVEQSRSIGLYHIRRIFETGKSVHDLTIESANILARVDPGTNFFGYTAINKDKSVQARLVAFKYLLNQNKGSTERYINGFLNSDIPRLNQFACETLCSKSFAKDGKSTLRNALCSGPSAKTTRLLHVTLYSAGWNKDVFQFISECLQTHNFTQYFAHKSYAKNSATYQAVSAGTKSSDHLFTSTPLNPVEVLKSIGLAQILKWNKAGGMLARNANGLLLAARRYETDETTAFILNSINNAPTLRSELQKVLGMPLTPYTPPTIY